MGVKSMINNSAALSLISVATLSSAILSNCFDCCSSNRINSFEAIADINTISNNFCSSSSLPYNVPHGFEAEDVDIADMLFSHEKRKVRLRVTAVKKHISNIELEEVFEEI